MSSPDDTRLVFGAHPVEELLRTSPESILELLVADGSRHQALLDAARKAGVTVSRAPMKALDRRASGTRHQGVLAVTAAFAYAELDGVLSALLQKPKALVVLLDSLQDPHNFGAIVRSACAFSADAVIIPKDRAVQVTPVVERAAAGTTSLLPIVRVTNLKRAIEALKEAGFWLVGAGTRGGTELPSFRFADKIGLVIGAEGEGLRSGIEASLDFVVTIPISERVESLNASNAAAVLLYAASQRS